MQKQADIGALFQVLNEVGIIHQLIQTEMNRRLPDGLHASHFGVLNHLVRLGDGRTPVSIASAFQVTKATMTNTLTTDVAATIAQVQAAAEAGADLVRVSVPDEASSKALKEITRESPVPIVADIHFHYKRGIEAAEAGAACLRINPGNIGDEKRVAEVIKAARDHNCSIRIGVNAGSLEKHLLDKYGEPCPDAMVESGLDHIRILQDHDFHEFKISVKASDVFMSAAAYQQLADATDAPIHLGITEAGGFVSGTIKSAIGLI